MEHLWNDTVGVQLKCSVKTCPNTALSTINPCNDLASNPSHLGKRPATNRLSYRTIKELYVLFRLYHTP
jgi:hypothetical protein